MVKIDELIGSVPILDPFNMNNVEGMWMNYSQILKSWSGHIEFRNGNTRGKQEFREEGEDAFPRLIEKMREFLLYVEKIS